MLAVLVVSTSLMFSCKSNSGDPKMVLSAFMDALAKKDMVAARKLATTDSKTMLDMMEMGMKKQDRRVKGNVDEISATIMLQEYMGNPW